MDTTKYPHPWEQDQALTDRLLKLVDDEDWDLFGIADVGPLNEKARPGRRPKDLWPTAKAVLMFAVGLAYPFTRGWVQNGKSGKFYSYALLELDRRVWTVKRFLRQEGYRYFGGESYGGALFDTGIRFADAAADINNHIAGRLHDIQAGAECGCKLALCMIYMAIILRKFLHFLFCKFALWEVSGFKYLKIFHKNIILSFKAYLFSVCSI